MRTTLTSRRTALCWLAVCFTLLVAGVSPDAAGACPVCYGGAEGDVIEGAKLSVFFMGGLVYTVMVGGVVMVVAARRRARRLEESEVGARPELVRDGEPSDRTVRTGRPDRPRGED